jgi:hypothetical protein
MNRLHAQLLELRELLLVCLRHLLTHPGTKCYSPR